MTEKNEEITPQEAEKVIEEIPTADNVVGDQGARVEDEEDDFDDDMGEFDEDDEDFEDDDR